MKTQLCPTKGAPTAFVGENQCSTATWLRNAVKQSLFSLGFSSINVVVYIMFFLKRGVHEKWKYIYTCTYCILKIPHIACIYSIYIYDSATQKISVALSQHLPWFFQSSSPIRVVFLRKIHLINPRVAGGNWGILPHAGPEDDLKSLDFNDMVILPSFFEGRLFFWNLRNQKTMELDGLSGIVFPNSNVWS